MVEIDNHCFRISAGIISSVDLTETSASVLSNISHHFGPTTALVLKMIIPLPLAKFHLTIAFREPFQ
jgi:hypothetical protein